MKTTIMELSVDRLLPNPYRHLDTYPWIEDKIEGLIRSIKDVGMWESIIARPAAAKEFELAFGHHRLEAARRAGLKTLPIIVRDLNDEQMVQFMGRENGEDYATDFMVMLNTWEGAVEFFGDNRKKPQSIDIAKLLGWIDLRKDGQTIINDTARACTAAQNLVAGGWIARSDLQGISVAAAKQIVERAQSRMEMIEKAAKETGATPQQTERAKKHYATGAKETAKDVREGRVAHRDIRATVDVHSFQAARASKTRDEPLFAAFAKGLVESLSRMLESDSVAERLNEVVKALGDIVMEEDQALVRQLRHELDEIGHRAVRWSKRLTPTKEKLVKFPAIDGGKD